jgi:SP family general alpha glucoside:H+ symporter-like MFS transporter
MYFIVPEVRGRTYEELDELFDARVPARKFASTKTKKQLLAEEIANSSHPLEAR